MSILEIKNLEVEIEKKQIIKDLSLEIKAGETHLLMGPNGSGKSSLTKTIIGHPAFKIKEGEIFFQKENLIKLETHERSKKGIFLLFQNPREISGVNFKDYLFALHKKKILNSCGLDIKEARKDKELRKELSPLNFKKKLQEKLPKLLLSEGILERELNQGFSGGEKKKSEIMQLEILKPKLALIDELDSGLDLDAQKLCFQSLSKLQEKEGTALLIISHHPEILDLIKVDKVHLFTAGKIQKTGNSELAKEIAAKGFLENYED